MGPERALELFDEMQRRGLQPDVITFLALISACEKACKPEKALELFAEMQRRGLQPNNITCNSLISCRKNACKPKQVLELFAEMQGRGLQTDGIACNARGMQFRYGHFWRSWAAAIGCPRRLDLGNKFERCTSSLH